jgi:DNA-directed RNA polymerase subunit F
MAEIEVLEEIPLSLVEVRESLEGVNKRDKEPLPKATKVLDYISKTNNMKLKEFNELKNKFHESGVERLKEKHIAKLIDIMPKDIDSIKAVFAGDNLILKQEDLKKILECIK